MSDPIQSFPLCWPDGWKRTPSYQRQRAKFSSYKRDLSVMDGVARVIDELERLGVKRDDLVISTNVRTRLDGLPRSDQGNPTDPGAAVYWEKKGKRQCLAIDHYDRVSDNLAAIAATLDAMRSIERHGGAEILDRAFTGFTALPAPEQPWQVLGVPMDANWETIRDAHRKLAMQHHPDRGGDAGAMARINAARDALMKSRA